MESPFIYNKHVTGNDFITRSAELNLLINLIKQNQHTLIYEPPKSGKRSLISQAILQLQKESWNFTLCQCNLFNVKSQLELIDKITNNLFSLYATTEEDWNEIAKRFLNGISFKVLNHNKFGQRYRINLPKKLDTPEINTIFELPEKLSSYYKTNIIVYIEEFQEILHHHDADSTLKAIDKIWITQKKCTYVLTGSFVNEMKEIFEVKKLMYNHVERIKLNNIDEKQMSAFMVRSFLKAGKVIPTELAEMMCKLVDYQPWYMQQLGDIIFGLTKGYVNSQLINLAYQRLVEQHSFRFRQNTSRLSHFQMNLLKAVLDGVTRFSSEEVLQKYELQSSANVNRLKEAVQKKEIIDFCNGQAIFLDPLFKNWLRDVYFSAS